MKFLVFLKQVPDAAEIKFNPEKKTIIREGVKNIINPYDRRAISEAVRYRNEHGGEVIVATMGPPQAKQALAEAIVMGADRAWHIEDLRLAGSDTLVTARVLAAAARRIDFDIIFAGQHSTDSETGQVPPALAELLGVPCAVSAKRIEYSEGFVRVTSETDEGTQLLELPLPAVISSAERLIKPIKVKDFDPSSVPDEKIELLRLEDLELDAIQVGTIGSPTWVAEIRKQRIERHPTMIDGSDPESAARKILEVIAAGAKRPQPRPLPAVTVSGDREFWCVVEHFQEGIRSVSGEILGGAASIASRHGGKICAIVTGRALTMEDSFVLSSCGADLIYHAGKQTLHPDEIVALLCERILAQRPYALFFPATSTGRYLAPRIAARLGLGLTGDCVGLSLDENGDLMHMKPAFGGMVLAPIYSKTYPQMATIRPGALPSYSPRSGDLVPVIEWNVPYNVARQFQILQEDPDLGAEAVRLDHARVVVCVGSGLGQQNVPLASRLADAFQGAVGATRRVVDAGWLPRQHQIGLTGKFIAPAVYLGLGVSGRYNHTIGIQKAGSIIAINSDPAAEIFKTSDLGVVGDCIVIANKLLQLVET